MAEIVAQLWRVVREGGGAYRLHACAETWAPPPPPAVVVWRGNALTREAAWRLAQNACSDLQGVPIPKPFESANVFDVIREQSDYRRKQKRVAPKKRRVDPKTAWRSDVLKLIRRVALAQREFTTDSVWSLLEQSRTGTVDPRVLGILMQRAVRLGWCVKSQDHVTSVRPECHHRPVPVWISKIHDPTAAVDVQLPEVPTNEEDPDKAVQNGKAPIKRVLARLLAEHSPQKLGTRRIAELLLARYPPEVVAILASDGVDATLLSTGIATHLHDLSRWYTHVGAERDPASRQKRMLYFSSKSVERTSKPYYRSRKK